MYIRSLLYIFPYVHPPLPLLPFKKKTSKTVIWAQFSILAATGRVYLPTQACFVFLCSDYGICIEITALFRCVFASHKTVCPSVRLSVRLSVRHARVEFSKNGILRLKLKKRIRNMKLCHLKEGSDKFASRSPEEHLLSELWQICYVTDDYLGILHADQSVHSRGNCDS